MTIMKENAYTVSHDDAPFNDGPCTVTQSIRNIKIVTQTFSHLTMDEILGVSMDNGHHVFFSEYHHHREVDTLPT